MEAEPLPYRSVLITGASGFVGGYLIAALRNRLCPQAVIHYAAGHDGKPIDLLDRERLRAMVRDVRPDIIFHLAGQASVGQSASTAAVTWRVNVCGTVNLAEIVATEAPEAVVAFASSSEVYGSAFNSGIVNEKSALAPLSVYGQTKRAAEDALSGMLSASNRLIIFRPTNHTGPGQDTRFVIPSFAHQVAAIEAGQRAPVLQVGSLAAERDFLDVRDVVSAYLDIVSVPSAERVETFNIASGAPVSIQSILDQLLSLTTVSIEVEQDLGRLRPSEVPRTLIDASKLRSSTGWTPSYELRTTIGAVLDGYRREHGIRRAP